jgi:hypothetical protein
VCMVSTINQLATYNSNIRVQLTLGESLSIPTI